MKINMFDQDWGLEPYAFLATYQVVVFEDSESENIKNFGSGFFLKHKDRMFFVTADHVVHYNDFFENETGQRTRVECYPHILTNAKKESKDIYIPLGGFYDYTEYKLDKDIVHNPDKFRLVSEKIINQDIDINDESLPLEIVLPSLVDIAICEVPESFPVPILTLEVRSSDGNIFVPANTLKLWLSSDRIAEFNKDDFYLVAGVICNEGAKKHIHQCPIKHIDMQFKEIDQWGDAILNVYEYPDITNWEGLSGSPVFNYKWELVGMLVAGPKSAPAVARVIPIDQIIEVINRNVKIEDTQYK